jgi:tetratricopeptide (TPR) repeat protein
MRGRDRRLPPPARPASAERKFHAELRRLVNASGLSTRELNELLASETAHDESAWEGWLNGDSVPPLRVVRDLAAKLGEGGTDAGRLVGLWAQAFLPSAYPAEPGGVPGRPRQLPAAMRSFMGRAEETEVLGELARQATAAGVDAAGVDPRSGPAGGRPTVAVIEGPIGVGKTSLAIHVAHQVKGRFPDGHLYISLRGFGDATDLVTDHHALREFLGAFGVPSRELPVDVDEQAALYRSLLAGRRVLVVIDNAHDFTQVRRLLPGSPGCLVLITTRAVPSDLAEAGTHVLHLGPLTDNEARDLLERRLGAARLRDEEQVAEELIALCGRLPLALSVAAARAAADPDLPLAALAAQLRSRGLGDGQADPAVTTRTVVAQSFAHLSEGAARMLRMLGACPGPDISLPAAASLSGVTVEQARAALDELTAAYLVDEHQPGRFSIHDLLQAYAADLALAVETEAGIDTGIDAAMRRLFDHYLRGMDAAVGLLYPTRPPVPLPEPVAGVRPESFGPQAHAQALAWFRAELPAVRSLIRYAARRGGFDAYCWRLPAVMAPVLARGSFLHDYLAAERTAIAAAGNLGDALGQGIAHYEFAHASALLGEVGESEAHLKEALRWFTKADEQAAAARAMNGMSQLLLQEGKYTQALEREAEALELRRAVGAPDQIAHSEQTMGQIYARLGRHDEAVRHCQRSLDLSRETGNRALSADALAVLGFVHLSLADHDKAVACYMEVLAIYREIGDNIGVAEALTGLGDAQHARGDVYAAGATWRQALVILTDLPNADVQPIQARLSHLI